MRNRENMMTRIHSEDNKEQNGNDGLPAAAFLAAAFAMVM